MLKVSTRSTYAIRALVHLARLAGDSPIRLADIAELQNIPLPYLEQIFSKLKKAGLVQAVRGPQGGYRLMKHPSDISLANIIFILEGPQQPVLCSMPENFSANCHDVDGCASRSLCNELDGTLTSILSRHTLAGLCGEAERLNQPRIRLNF